MLNIVYFVPLIGRNLPEKGFFTANELVAVDEDTRYVTEEEHEDNADEQRGKVHFLLHWVP